MVQTSTEEDGTHGTAGSRMLPYEWTCWFGLDHIDVIHTVVG